MALSVENAKKLQYLFADGHEIDFIQTFMKIVDKNTNIIPFKMTGEQKDLVEGLEKFNIISKSRQLGISTVTIGLSLRESIVHPNSNCLLVSYDQKSCNAIFNKLKQQYELLPSWLKPKEIANNRQELKFTNGSRITCATAGNKSLGRGDTLHIVHLSEMAFYKDPQKHLNSILQSLAPTGKLIIESTSNGLNYYSDLVIGADKKENDFKLFFYNWINGGTLFQDDYVQAVQRYKARNNNTMLTMEDLTEDEGHLVSLGATLEQLVWRRLKIDNTSLEEFKQEFPSTLMESFLSTGHNVFSGEILTEIEMAITNNKVSEIPLKNIVDLPSSLKMLSKSLFIYNLPQKGERYYFGVDVSDGVGGDNSVIEVFNSNKQQCAEFRSNTTKPYELAEIVRDLGYYYNGALLTVEKNKSGDTVVYKLWKEFNYGNMYKYKSYDQRNKMVYSRGFDTNHQSKTLIINQYIELFERRQLQLNSKFLLGEMKVFTSDFKAEGTKHDDTVMATALALEGLNYKFWYKA